MQQCTLIFPVRDGKVLLARKKKETLGQGKWNGYGGKVETHESVLEAACRELREESGMIASPDDLLEHGRIEFYFPDNPRWDQCVTVYLLERWDGEPRETSEMHAPEWFEELPVENMWVADTHWLPYALQRRYVEATVRFKGMGEALDYLRIHRPVERTIHG